MSASGLALQQAIFIALTNDAPLLAALGGPHVFDGAPQSRTFPYVTFAQTRVVDWSTGSEAGDEHLLTLHVWSRAAGKKEVHVLITALREALHEAPLTLDGHRLVNLRHEFSEIRREPDGETWRGLVRLRAVTEPL
jgi:hypothetical protein